MTRQLRPRGRIRVRSSNIAAIGYYPQERILEVEFSNNGAIYHYYDVPPEEYEGIINAPSHGKYLHRRIARLYRYARVDDPDRQRERRSSAPAYRMHATSWCYEILGVPVDADLENVRRAYVEMAKEWHPDKGGDVEVMKRVNEAYDLIKQSRQFGKM